MFIHNSILIIFHIHNLISLHESNLWPLIYLDNFHISKVFSIERSVFMFIGVFSIERRVFMFIGAVTITFPCQDFTLSVVCCQLSYIYSSFLSE